MILNTKKVRDYKELTKENILKEVDEKTLFQFYFQNEIDFKKTYTNPLRNDKNEGCRFFIGYSGKLLFIDFSKGTIRDVFGFICDKHLTNLYGALQIINNDFRLGLGNSDNIYIPRVLREQSVYKELKKSELLCLKRNWNDEDIKFWYEYGITKETLTKFNVIPVSKVFLNNKTIASSTLEDPLYCYWFPIFNKKKIYRPKNSDKKRRFISDKDIGQTIQGFDQLPEKGPFVVITKSMKDVMVLYEFDVPAIAPHGEGYNVSSDLVDLLYARFDNVLVFYDNDIAGLEAMERLNQEHGLYCTSIPDYFKSKDISDLYKDEGAIMTRAVLRQLIPLYEQGRK